MTITTLKHIELGGNYSNRPKTIIDTCLLFGEYETMVMNQHGEEKDCITSDTEAEAIKSFNALVKKYAEPLQKAFWNKLESGKKYTLVYLSEFGFPIVEKITFHEMTLTTYAQYSDVVQLIYTPFRKRNARKHTIYNKSVLVFEGWQELKEEYTHDILSDNGSVKTLKSKYSCFSSNYIEDAERFLKNPIIIYKDYKIGVNGKSYA